MAIPFRKRLADQDAGDDDFVAFGDGVEGFARFEYRHLVGLLGVHRVHSSYWLGGADAGDREGTFSDGLELRIFVQCRLLVGLLGFHESLLRKEISL